MGIIGFIYESVKDSLKEENMSVRRHRREIMSIGRLVYLDDKKFQEAIRAQNTISVSDMSEDEINKLAGV